jgi:hypothetical protein
VVAQAGIIELRCLKTFTCLSEERRNLLRDRIIGIDAEVCLAGLVSKKRKGKGKQGQVSGSQPT